MATGALVLFLTQQFDFELTWHNGIQQVSYINDGPLSGLDPRQTLLITTLGLSLLAVPMWLYLHLALFSASGGLCNLATVVAPPAVASAAQSSQASAAALQSAPSDRTSAFFSFNISECADGEC